jgi:hypothetical protein
MSRLGYSRFVAQGGDWGNAVTEQMALLKPPGLLGIHTNMPATVPPEISRAIAIGDPAPTGLSADEQTAFDVLVHFFATGVGYAGRQGWGDGLRGGRVCHVHTRGQPGRRRCPTQHRPPRRHPRPA